MKEKFLLKTKALLKSSALYQMNKQNKKTVKCLGHLNNS